jgi:hypothetical protein
MARTLVAAGAGRPRAALPRPLTQG